MDTCKKWIIQTNYRVVGAEWNGQLPTQFFGLPLLNCEICPPNLAASLKDFLVLPIHFETAFYDPELGFQKYFAKVGLP